MRTQISFASATCFIITPAKPATRRWLNTPCNIYRYPAPQMAVVFWWEEFCWQIKRLLHLRGTLRLLAERMTPLLGPSFERPSQILPHTNGLSGGTNATACYPIMTSGTLYWNKRLLLSAEIRAVRHP